MESWMKPMTYSALQLETDGEVAILRLNRPGGNLLNVELVEEMNDALLNLRRERSLEVLIIRGSRDCFSDGFDLNDLSAQRTQRLIQVYMRLFETLRLMDVIEI